MKNMKNEFGLFLVKDGEIFPYHEETQTVILRDGGRILEEDEAGMLMTRDEINKVLE